MLVKINETFITLPTMSIENPLPHIPICVSETQNRKWISTDHNWNISRFVDSKHKSGNGNKHNTGNEIAQATIFETLPSCFPRDGILAGVSAIVRFGTGWHYGCTIGGQVPLLIRIFTVLVLWHPSHNSWVLWESVLVRNKFWIWFRACQFGTNHG